MFLSLDGVDGVGKSTQLTLLAQWFRDRGQEPVTCRDPGSTALGEALRSMVLGKDLAIAGRAEMLVYMAARAQLVDEIVRPALDAGRVVISDRFLLSNVVYQGYAGGLDVESIWAVGRVATGGCMPDLSIVLDMDVDAAAARIDREPDRLESRGRPYRARVRQGFLSEAARQPDRIAVIDAARPADAVQADLRDRIARLLPR